MFVLMVILVVLIFISLLTGALDSLGQVKPRVALTASRTCSMREVKEVYDFQELVITAAPFV